MSEADVRSNALIAARHSEATGAGHLVEPFLMPGHVRDVCRLKASPYSNRHQNALCIKGNLG